MEEDAQRFEQIVLPHLPAGYNLARWLTKNDRDGEDVAQEAFLRAFRGFAGYRGGDVRAWLLAIVRNTCYTWLRRNRSHDLGPLADGDLDDGARCPRDAAPDPEALLLQDADRHRLRQALEALPAEFREAIVLREMEGLSYKEIAQVADIPLGTVMSRLARARKHLQRSLAIEAQARSGR